MADSTYKLAAKEKIGYACGDIATNFFFQSMILYQTRFYTDTAGLSAVAVGSMFLLLRLGDAIIDPVIGALSDRTQTRWGKFRPWILGTAVPFGLIFWLVYVTPNFGPHGKLVYAYITYSLVMMLYSANNTPYSALMGVMTPDSSERSSIASYRFVGALIGQFIIQALPLPLVAKLGHGDSARGWATTMAIFGALIIVLNLITFAATRERVPTAPGQRPSLRADLKDVFTCGPWIVMFILTLLIFTMLVVRGSSLNYLFAYYLDQGTIKAFLDKIGLAAVGGPVTGWKSALNALGLLVNPDGSNAAAVGLSLFFVGGSVIQIVGIVFSKPLADRFGKKAVFIAGMAVTTVATVLVFFATPTSMTLLVVLGILWPIMYAGILFALKAGLSLGGALSAWVIAAYGYIPNVAQTQHALLGIRLGASIYPGVALILSLACLAIYPIGKALNLRIQDELTERRRKYATPNPAAATS